MFFSKEDEVKTIDEVLTSDPFISLDINFTDIDLKMEIGDHFEVHYHGPSDKKPLLTQDDQLLKLKEPDVKRKNGKVWKKGVFKVEVITSNDVGRVKIIVPKDQQLNEVKLNFASADVGIKDININNLYFNSASGDLRIENSDLIKIDFTVVSGDLKLDNVKVTSGKSNMISGDFDMKNSQILKKLKVETISGNNKVENTEVDQCDLSSISGDNLIFGGKATLAQVGQETNGSRLNLSTVSGDNIVK